MAPITVESLGEVGGKDSDITVSRKHGADGMLEGDIEQQWWIPWV